MGTVSPFSSRLSEREVDDRSRIKPGPYACTVRARDHALGHHHKAKPAHVIPRHLGHLVVAHGRNIAKITHFEVKEAIDKRTAWCWFLYS